MQSADCSEEDAINAYIDAGKNFDQALKYARSRGSSYGRRGIFNHNYY